MLQKMNLKHIFWDLSAKKILDGSEERKNQHRLPKTGCNVCTKLVMLFSLALAKNAFSSQNIICFQINTLYFSLILVSQTHNNMKQTLPTVKMFYLLLVK